MGVLTMLFCSNYGLLECEERRQWSGGCVDLGDLRGNLFL